MQLSLLLLLLFLMALACKGRPVATCAAITVIGSGGRRKVGAVVGLYASGAGN